MSQYLSRCGWATGRLSRNINFTGLLGCLGVAFVGFAAIVGPKWIRHLVGTPAYAGVAFVLFIWGMFFNVIYSTGTVTVYPRRDRPQRPRTAWGPVFVSAAVTAVLAIVVALITHRYIDGPRG